MQKSADALLLPHDSAHGSFSSERGYAMLAAVILVALVAFATLVPVQSARLDAQREREAELLFIGAQYRAALVRYYEQTPGAVKQFPAELTDLLEDKRFPQPRRHLRKLYADPITGQVDWQLDRAQGRIVGLASRSTAVPLKRANFPREFDGFAQAASYADWRFLAAPNSGVNSNAPPEAPAPAPPRQTPPAEPPVATPATPPNDPPGEPDSRLSSCAEAHTARLQRCIAMEFGAAEQRQCRLESSRAYAACLSGR